MRKAGIKVRYWRKRPVPAERAKQAGGAGVAAGRGVRLMVCAIVVFVVGVAGSASAAVLIGSKQVKDGSLTGRDLTSGTVRSSDVRDGSLKRRDFGVVPKGPAGPTGPVGPRGLPGDPGLTYAEVTRTVPATSTVTIAVPCTAPQRAVFGGSSLGGDGLLWMLQSAPAIDGSAWDFVVRNFHVFDKSVDFMAICVTDR